MMTFTSEARDEMRIDWDVPIEMDDGLVLRADVFRPLDERPCPVIMSHGPYGKGRPMQESHTSQWNTLIRNHPEVLEGSSNRYQAWETVDPEKWVPHGYACVRVDSRGSGRSPGYLDPLSPRETRDFSACIEWAGTREWSNGRVGLAGISYYAMNQWHVAALQPPHLEAMVPWEGSADFYRDMTHHGGMLCTFFPNWYDIQVKVIQYGVGDESEVNPTTGEPAWGGPALSAEELAANRCDFAQDILDHPLDDQHHRDRSANWERVTVPLLSCGNWGGQGLHLRGNTEGFTQSASQEKWLELHGREHWTGFYTDEGIALQMRFFDHYLKGLDNGWDRTPPVLLNVRHLDHFVPREEHEWPLARTRWTPLHLDVAHHHLSWDPPGQPGRVTYETRGDGVTLHAPPLEEETELTGPISLKLPISSSTVDADIFAVLRVFSPQDEEVVFQGAIDPNAPIGQGWLRASHRKLDPERSTASRPYHLHDEVEPLEPGQVYQLDIEIWPTCIVIPAGYRIALTIRGTDFEHDLGGDRIPSFRNTLRGSGPFLHNDPRDRPDRVFDGEVTLHTGGDLAAELLLPIVPPSEESR